VFSAWAVSIYIIKALLGAVTEKPLVLMDIGALGAVFSCYMAGLSTDVTADIFCGAVALVGGV
jgi:hypothetical protein